MPIAASTRRAPTVAECDELERRTQAWIDDDPDPACRQELRALLENGGFSELRERFGEPLKFGTAGLRAPLGAGPSRINRATVRQATAGLAAYLIEVSSGSPTAVVVGHDARHGSADLAQETAAVLAGAGVRALRLPRALPTPVLAFAIRRLQAAGGVMITASHNPPGDNGYKVFLGDGAQIAPPVDEQITSCIERVRSLSDVPLGRPGEVVDERIVEDYVDEIVAALPCNPRSRRRSSPKPLRVVYTPLHGVGRDVLLAAFSAAGLSRPRLVESQERPDPRFPTVARPNPEEPGTLNLALTAARRENADLMLATDPDADRLAVAVPTPDDARHWRVLTGDEIGVLLAEHLIAHADDRAHSLLISTIVSSSLLARMADAAGIPYIETLTGFKWMMQVVRETEPERRLLFAYEEALGFAVNGVVRDKDGISAALLMYQVAAAARHEGFTLHDRLDDLARRFGLHVTRQVSVEMPGADGKHQLEDAMRAVRRSPPDRLGGRPITDVADLALGASSWGSGNGSRSLPRADVLVLRCGEEIRVVIRPSGTEPKLKLYLQIVIDVAQTRVARARQAADAALDALADELRAMVRA